MLACSLILSWIDYCNAVLHGAPTGTIQKLQRVQNNAAQIVLQVQTEAKGLFAYRHQKPGTVYPTTSDWKPAQTALNEN